MGNKQTEWESTLVGQEADLQECYEEEKKTTLRVFENLYGEWLYRGTDDGLVFFSLSSFYLLVMSLNDALTASVVQFGSFSEFSVFNLSQSTMLLVLTLVDRHCC